VESSSRQGACPGDPVLARGFNDNSFILDASLSAANASGGNLVNQHRR
jgi:hypothetical protein